MRKAIKNINWKQGSNLPANIKLGLKIVAVACGFYFFGTDFIWVVLGLTFSYRLLRGLASCLLSLISLIGFFWFLFTHIF